VAEDTRETKCEKYNHNLKILFPEFGRKASRDCVSNTEGAVMEGYQWFLLGMMVAWTPGLVVLALMLRKQHLPN
jgi:hypothetical protein